AAVERERTQRAEDLAKVPQRLRRERYRSGRRVGAADPAGDGSWLWFVMDGAPPAPDALARQLEIVEVSPNTAAVGAKRVRHAEAELRKDETRKRLEWGGALVDVGLTPTHGGRSSSRGNQGKTDRGQ